MTRTIVQHSFGEPNSGGPINALTRVLSSRLATQYHFLRMHQPSRSAGLGLRLVLRWARMLRRERPDLVHVRGLGNEGFRGVLAARLARCPRVLVTIHGTHRDLTGPQSIRRRVVVSVLEPATLRMATHVATVCEAAAERTLLDPYRRKVAGVVINGVDLPEQSPTARAGVRVALGIPDDRLVAVVVARLSVDKGHLVLADALTELARRAPLPTLLVLGDGPDEGAITDAYGAVPGLDVRMLGRRADVTDILLGSDLFVFPSLHENLSNALLEGMAAALPVVATAVGGNVEVLSRGGGVLVPPSDVASLTDALAGMLADPVLRSAHGARARQTVADHYTVEHMIEALHRVYQHVLSEGGGR